MIHDTMARMEGIRQLVSRAVRRAGVEPSIDAARVVVAAEEVLATIFEPAIAVRMKPLYLKNRTLTVSCDSSTVAQELKLREPDILAALTKKLGNTLVDRLRYFS